MTRAKKWMGHSPDWKALDEEHEKEQRRTAAGRRALREAERAAEIERDLRGRNRPRVPGSRRDLIEQRKLIGSPRNRAREAGSRRDRAYSDPAR